MDFNLKSNFQPTGDQPAAIKELLSGLTNNHQHQVLLGVTGSGKTFTMANIIAKYNRPTLIISHNKTLAAQLYQEFRDFFPDNAVSYFVSYYDYYQPEAYIPQTDTYIEKETEINEEIDKLRLAATTNLLTRKDTIIIASVSCIYNIGSPKEYGNFVLELKPGVKITRDSIIKRLVDLQYANSNFEFKRGTFRIRGNILDIFPAYQDTAIRLKLNMTHIESIYSLDPYSGKTVEETWGTVIYPAKHYMTNPEKYETVFTQIRNDLDSHVKKLKKEGKKLEAYRINQRVNYDLEMIQEIGYVNGIENYSRYFDGRNPGDPPFSLLDYFNDPYGKDWLMIIDESHITIPQIRGMYHGDRSRKQTLIDFGFRLPAAMDNRPLMFSEFMQRIPSVIYTSATPNEWEISLAKEEAHRHKAKNNGIVQQLIRPTGIIDPQIIVKPSEGQIIDLAREIINRKEKNERVLVTTLTKRTAEDLTAYLNDKKYIEMIPTKEYPIVQYLHSDIETLERSDILDNLRLGKYDVIIGINLLREGLDLPEVSLVAILDADKEGFLRSETSLIQTMGRAARHINGTVIMYADQVTRSMENAIKEINRRREIQIEYNLKHGIIPQSIKKPIREKIAPYEGNLENSETNKYNLSNDANLNKLISIDNNSLTPSDKTKLLKLFKNEMRKAANSLNFELAAKLRDRILEIEKDKE